MVMLMLYTAIYVIIIISMKVVYPLIMRGQRTQFDLETQDAGSGVGVRDRVRYRVRGRPRTVVGNPR